VGRGKDDENGHHERGHDASDNEIFYGGSGRRLLLSEHHARNRIHDVLPVIVLPPVTVTIGNMPHRRSSKRASQRPELIARRAERRAQLLDVADRVIRRDGPSASINHIAAEAGIAKPVLYRHFGDKGGLYQALAERYVRSLMDELRVALERPTEPPERLATTIDTYLRFVEENPEVYRFLMHRAVGEQPEAQATVADFMRQVSNEIAIVLGDVLKSAGLDSGGAEPWAHGLVGMVELAGDWWLRNRSMSRARLVAYLTDLVWKGFQGIATEELAARDSQPASG
jgi:AcrR family transcriptional regulator